MPKRSSAWNYFCKKDDGGTAECLKCKKVIKCVGGSTSGLFVHLKSAHKISDIDLNNESESLKKQKTLMPFITKKSMDEEISKLAARDGLSFKCIASSDFIQENLKRNLYDKPPPTTRQSNVSATGSQEQCIENSEPSLPASCEEQLPNTSAFGGLREPELSSSGEQWETVVKHELESTSVGELWATAGIHEPGPEAQSQVDQPYVAKSPATSAALPPSPFQALSFDPTFPPSPPRVSKSKKRRQESGDAEEINVLNLAVKKFMEPADENSVYGDYVASELRMLPENEQRVYMRHRLNKTVCEVKEELGIVIPRNRSLISKDYVPISSNSSSQIRGESTQEIPSISHLQANTSISPKLYLKSEPDFGYEGVTSNHRFSDKPGISSSQDNTNLNSQQPSCGDSHKKSSKIDIHDIFGENIANYLRAMPREQAITMQAKMYEMLMRLKSLNT